MDIINYLNDGYNIFYMLGMILLGIFPFAVISGYKSWKKENKILSDLSLRRTSASQLLKQINQKLKSVTGLTSRIGVAYQGLYGNMQISYFGISKFGTTDFAKNKPAVHVKCSHLNLPGFYLKPRYFSKESSKNFRQIYSLSGNDGADLISFFNDDRLQYFIDNPGLVVDGFGDEFIAYKTYGKSSIENFVYIYESVNEEIFHDLRGLANELVSVLK